MNTAIREFFTGRNWLYHPVTVALIAIAAACVVGLALAVLAGATLSQTISSMIEGMVGTPYAIGESMNTAAVLILIAAGFTIAFRAGLVNVGGEGQLVAGGIAAAAVGTSLSPGVPALLAIPAVLAAATVAGWLWAAIAAFLRVKRGVSEIITTLLLNFVALAHLRLMVQEPSLLRQPVTSAETLPQSAPLVESTHLPLLGIEGSSATLAIILALIVVVAVGIVLQRTEIGLKLRSVGLSPTASSRLGIPIGRYMFQSLSMAGAAAGLAGGILVATSPFVLAEGFTSGYGFTGLVVGLLARGSMLAVIAVSALLALLTSGGINLQIVAGVPSSTVAVVTGLIMVFIAGAAILGTSGGKHRRVRAKPGDPQIDLTPGESTDKLTPAHTPGEPGSDVPSGAPASPSEPAPRLTKQQPAVDQGGGPR